MNSTRTVILFGLALAAAAGLGASVAEVASGSPSHPSATSPAPRRSLSASGGHAHGGSHMQGGNMQGIAGGSGADIGKMLGQMYADAPGPRVSPAQAAWLGNEVPPAAVVNRTARTITFTTAAVRLTVLASPVTSDMKFRIAGMTDPTITVPSGAKVTIEVINADNDTAHGLVITNKLTHPGNDPMHSGAYPVFGDSAVWILGYLTAAGMHAGTMSFTATTPGTYSYLCPMPGHAQMGMLGTFRVA
jgi:uncharacterized cupredoxin-like copper-binding protein